MDEISRELGLNRAALVSLALLLGSDYTEGINGIGIVNATEVLQSFGTDLNALKRFRDWMWGNLPEEGMHPKERGFAASHGKVKKSWEVCKLLLPVNGVVVDWF